MFLILLVAEVILSLVVAWCVVRILHQPIEVILNRITADETGRAWLKYVKFAIYVAGVSGGVRVAERDIEKVGMMMMDRGFAGLDPRIYMYMAPQLALEICGAVVGALRGIFWFLGYFFIAAAIAFVIVRVIELIKSKPAAPQDRA